MKTVLQVPMSQELKTKATLAAKAQGFSSLQEVVRLMVTQFSQDTLTLNFDNIAKLSKKNDVRYDKMVEDFSKNRSVGVADSPQDFLRQLKENED